MPPILGMPLPAKPLPLLGRPAGPPCHDVSPPKPYPRGALSLLARLSFFPCERFPRPGPEAVPGEDSDDMDDTPSAEAEPLASSDMRWRLVLILPDGSHPEPSSKRSMVTDPGDGGRGVDEVLSPREYVTCWKLCCLDSECGPWCGWWCWGGKSVVVGLELGLLMECMEWSDGLLMFIDNGGGKRDAGFVADGEVMYMPGLSFSNNSEGNWGTGRWTDRN